MKYTLEALYQTLAIENVILKNLPTTVGLDHPARQATVERIAALQETIDRMRASIK